MLNLTGCILIFSDVLKSDTPFAIIYSNYLWKYDEKLINKGFTEIQQWDLEELVVEALAMDTNIQNLDHISLSL